MHLTGSDMASRRPPPPATRPNPSPRCGRRISGIVRERAAPLPSASPDVGKTVNVRHRLHLWVLARFPLDRRSTSGVFPSAAVRARPTFRTPRGIRGALEGGAGSAAHPPKTAGLFRPHSCRLIVHRTTRPGVSLRRPLGSRGASGRGTGSPSVVATYASTPRRRSATARKGASGASRSERGWGSGVRGESEAWSRSQPAAQGRIER